MAFSKTFRRVEAILCLIGGVAIAWYTNLYSAVIAPNLGDNCVAIIVWICASDCLAIALSIAVDCVSPYLIPIPLQPYQRSTVTTLDLNRENDAEMDIDETHPPNLSAEEAGMELNLNS